MSLRRTSLKRLLERYRRNPLWSNTAELGALQIIGYLLPLVTLPYLLRVLGTDNYGLLGLTLAVAGNFGSLADFGFGYTAVRAIASSRQDPARLPIAFSTFVIAKLALALPVWAALIACSYLLPLRPDTASLLRIASPLLPLWALNLGWYFQGLQTLRPSVTWQIAVRLGGLLLLFSIVRRRTDLAAALCVELSMAFASACGSWILVRRLAPVPFRWPSTEAVRQAVLDSAKVFASSLASLLYTNGLTLILGFAASREQVAYYVIAERVNNAIKRLLSPFLQALVPHVSQIQERNRAKALDFLRLLLHRVVLLGLIATLLIAAAAPILISLIGGRAALPALRVLLAMLPQSLLVAVSNIVGVQTLFAFGLIAQVVRAQFFVGALTVGAAYVAATHFGAIGVAVTGTAAEALIVLAVFRASRRHLNFP